MSSDSFPIGDSGYDPDAFITVYPTDTIKRGFFSGGITFGVPGSAGSAVSGGSAGSAGSTGSDAAEREISKLEEAEKNASDNKVQSMWKTTLLKGLGLLGTYGLGTVGFKLISYVLDQYKLGSFMNKQFESLFNETSINALSKFLGQDANKIKKTPWFRRMYLNNMIDPTQDNEAKLFYSKMMNKYVDDVTTLSFAQMKAEVQRSNQIRSGERMMSWGESIAQMANSYVF